MHLSYLGSMILCSHILSFLSTHHREAYGSQIADILPQDSPAYFGGLQPLMAGTFPLFRNPPLLVGFPDSSVGKESTCNAPVWFLGGGRSAGERIGCPLQYSLASLVAQLGKYPPTMRETWVRSLGWEDPLEKRKVTHSSILVWRIPWPTVLWVAKRWTQLRDFHFTFPSWSGIWPIFGRYFVIKFCPTVLGDSF